MAKYIPHFAAKTGADEETFHRGLKTFPLIIHEQEEYQDEMAEPAKRIADPKDGSCGAPISSTAGRQHSQFSLIYPPVAQAKVAAQGSSGDLSLAWSCAHRLSWPLR